MEKIAEFDKEIIATVCGSFRRGIGSGRLLSDECNNPFSLHFLVLRHNRILN